jgi:hypothetical protein
MHVFLNVKRSFPFDGKLGFRFSAYRERIEKYLRKINVYTQSSCNGGITTVLAVWKVMYGD